MKEVISLNYCPSCGSKLEEIGMGYLKCTNSNCEIVYFSTINAEHTQEIVIIPQKPIKVIQQFSNKVMEAYLLNCGWRKTYDQYQFEQWLIEPAGGPNWYRSMNLDDAFKHQIEENSEPNLVKCVEYSEFAIGTTVGEFYIMLTKLSDEMITIINDNGSLINVYSEDFEEC